MFSEHAGNTGTCDVLALGEIEAVSDSRTARNRGQVRPPSSRGTPNFLPRDIILENAVGGSTEVTEILEELHRVMLRRNRIAENPSASRVRRKVAQERRNAL
jgi:hypothetical protein